MSRHDKKIRCLRRRIDRLDRVLIPDATAKNIGTLSYLQEEARTLRWALEQLERIEQAIDLIVRHGDAGGEPHKAWVIDQVARILAGGRYYHVVAEARRGEDGPTSYAWDVGVAP